MTVALLVLLCCAAGAASQAVPEATVATGRLRGKWLTSRGGRNFTAFEGIPYAAPPVNQLRFQAPQPAVPWTGVLNATAPGAPCVQWALNPGAQEAMGYEDCLYINVYAPEPLPRDNLLDVMVFVHGGGFVVGQGYSTGPEFIMDHDVIYVNFNYRLGPFGFLSTLDDVIPGNAGLKDQVQALRWVRDNIRAFGGNPDNVMLFGESAGGVSVHLHTLSPLSKGLFHRALSQSGTALSPWAVARSAAEPQAYNSRLAAALGCPTQPSAALRDCLLAKEAGDIALVQRGFLEFVSFLPLGFFRPVVEAAGVQGAFLQRDPLDILANGGPVSDVPTVFGVNANEGGYWAVGVHENSTALQEFSENFDSISPMILIIRDLPNDVVQNTTRQLRRFYFGNDIVTGDKKFNTIDFFTDSLFLWGVIRTVKYHAQYANSPVYFFELAHEGRRSYSMIAGSKYADYGVCHCDDLLLLFPSDDSFPDVSPSETDIQMSEKFVQLFVDFASSGNFSRVGSWSRVTHPDAAEYLRISSPTDQTLHSNYARERMLAWKMLPAPIGESSSANSASAAASRRHGYDLTCLWIVGTATLAMIVIQRP